MKQLLENSKSFLIRHVKPLSGMIIFFLVLAVTHFLWHALFKGGANGINSDQLSFLGHDISVEVRKFSQWQADIVAVMMNRMNIGFEQFDTAFLFHNGRAVRIVWGCTGIRQAFSLFFVILFCRMTPLQKLWWLPTSMVLLLIFNFFRLMVINYNFSIDPDTFHFWHEFFRFAIYAYIGVVWFIGEEVIGRRLNKSGK